MGAVDKLLSWLDTLAWLLLWVGVAAGFLMMVHVTADVAGRTMFNHPLPGTTEIISVWYMVTVAFLPWAFIARDDSHIVVDLFTRSAPEKFRVVLDVVVKLVTAAWVLFFAYHTFIRAIQQTELDEVWEAGGFLVLAWPARWLLPVAGLSMGLYLVLRVASDLGRASHRRRARS